MNADELSKKLNLKPKESSRRIEEIYNSLKIDPRSLQRDGYYVFRTLVNRALYERKLAEVVAFYRRYQFTGRYPNDTIKLEVRRGGSFTVTVTNGNPVTPSNFSAKDFSGNYAPYSFTSYTDYLSRGITFYYKEAISLILEVVAQVEMFLKNLNKHEEGYKIPLDYQVHYISRSNIKNPLTSGVKFDHPTDSEGHPIEPFLSIKA